MKTVENLLPGEVLLVAAKRVKGGKVQLEFAEIINGVSGKPQGIAGLLNASDDRFTGGGARRAWEAGMPSDIEKVFGVKVSDLTEEGATKEFNILNPAINGQRVSIQINETTDGNEYELANYEARAKRMGKDGAYILHEGKYIFSRTKVVLGKAQHTILKADATATVAASLASDIEEAIG